MSRAARTGRYKQLIFIIINSLLVAFLSSCSDDTGQTPTPQKQVAVVPAPASPENINILPADSQAIITWSNVEHASSYNLYMATATGISPQNYQTIEGGTLQEGVNSPHIIRDMDNTKAYYLILTSKNTSGESAASEETNIAPYITVPLPTKPVFNKAKTGSNQVTLLWDKIPGALNYHVYLTYPDDVDEELRGTTQQFTLQNTSFTITELENDKTYLFALSVENEAGESDLSDLISATPKQRIIRPARPTGLSAKIDQDGKVIIDWELKDDINLYNLFISTDPTISSRNYQQLSAGNAIRDIFPPYSIENLTAKHYYIVLNAKNDDGTSYDTKAVKISLASTAVIDAPAPVKVISIEDQLEEDDGNRPYIKLNAKGEILIGQRKKYKAQPWACVRNKKTGMMWEVKTLGKDFQSAEKSYAWHQTTQNGVWTRSKNAACKDDVCDMEEYIDKINDISLCGYDDWRMPTKNELASLLDKTQEYPTPKINTRFFPNTGNKYYWSGNSYKHNNSLAWFVYFSSGYVYLDIKTNPMLIRAVRNIKAKSASTIGE